MTFRPGPVAGPPDGWAPPTVQSLRAAVSAFLGLDTATRPPPPASSYAPLGHDDPAAALTWLNSWGCRIRYPRPGEPDLFGPGLRAWTARWCPRLPGPDARLGSLTDEELAPLGDCFAELAAVRAGPAERPRTLGATAAAKLLHGLRPHTLVPWDEAIARKLHGARDAGAYVAHQRLNGEWARLVLAGSGMDEDGIAMLYGCPGRPLAKMLDDYAYITLTRSDTQ
ncbi:hypothetical protein ACFYNV_10315 [Streptomyces albidoflavus]|uniref:hypothetical protein n=1 Tax=Streptomyces TaxID=1883 RepID=UPI001E2ABEB0|nr:hypothetical protein [Streptomyces sp. OUCMDZ-3434]